MRIAYDYITGAKVYECKVDDAYESSDDEDKILGSSYIDHVN